VYLPAEGILSAPLHSGLVAVLGRTAFVLPPLVLLAGHLALGGRADAMLGRLRDRVGRGAREGLLWLLGLVGFFLLADAVGHFRSID
jgi:hypothetical protein